MSGENNDGRARPAAPAWATVPTTAWQRVNPDDEPELDENGKVKPPIPRQGGRGRVRADAPAVPDRPGTGRAAVPAQRAGQPGPQGAARGGPRAVPPGQLPPGQLPPGQLPPGPYPPGHAPLPPGVVPPGSVPPGTMPPGPVSPGQLPPGPYPPGHAPRRPGAPQAYAEPRGPRQGPPPGYPGARPPAGPFPPAHPAGRPPVGPPGTIPSWAGPTPQPDVAAPATVYAGVARPPTVPGNAPTSGVPTSGTPASSAPASAPPVSGGPAIAPVSATPVSASPMSAMPVSATPVSATPVSGGPDAADPDVLEPISGTPDSISGPPVSAPPDSSGPDPEQILSTFEWVFDPETLREVNEDPEGLAEVREMLTAKINLHTDNASRARLLSLRAVVSRIAGDLHKALADAKLALAHAEATGELRRIAICQARLAHVLQWRGEYAEADRLFTLANSSELPARLRGTMHQHAGKSAYDQGRYIEACNHFERALELRKEEDPDLIAATDLALDAVFRKVAVNGWGPYPRTREELLQLAIPPGPSMDDKTGLWGFATADGELQIDAKYADVQPFRDGAAWVRRPEFEAWELIDDKGATLIPPTGGYLGVSSFAGGLAWVSRDGNGKWIAIDKTNTVTISTGFDDVRPFRSGIAAVRRARFWGAVDGVGRVIVPFRFDGFDTALSDGRYIDGFSDEGLAVVIAKGRKGVVNRAGKIVVEPVFQQLVIDPVAFLIMDESSRWGALDRKGRILIDPTHPSRGSVAMEIDRLMGDAKPVL